MLSVNSKLNTKGEKRETTDLFNKIFYSQNTFDKCYWIYLTVLFYLQMKQIDLFKFKLNNKNDDKFLWIVGQAKEVHVVSENSNDSSSRRGLQAGQ